MAAAATDTDEERWQQALSLVAGRPTPGALDAQQRQQRRTLVVLAVVVGACVLVGAVVGVLLMVLLPSSPADPDDVPVWREAAGFACIFAALVLLGLHIARVARSGQWGERWRSPLTPLSWSQRLEVGREVSGRRPVVPEHLPVLLHHASRVVRCGSVPLLWAGILLEMVGQLLMAHDDFLVAVFLPVTAMMITAVPVNLLAVRRARRFLQRCGAAPRG